MHVYAAARGYGFHFDGTALTIRHEWLPFPGCVRRIPLEAVHWCVVLRRPESSGRQPDLLALRLAPGVRLPRVLNGVRGLDVPRRRLTDFAALAEAVTGASAHRARMVMERRYGPGPWTAGTRQRIGHDLAPVTFYAPHLDRLLNVVRSGSRPPATLGRWLSEHPGSRELACALFALVGRIEGDRPVTGEPGWAEIADRLGREAEAVRRVGVWRESRYHG
ncbi:hypothetical protein [Streptomyces sp. CC77]|uniref:hypothetical protein n=1 Tax=Streptomyces sp. CC77 TaxID=1906739 RepID=UPI0008DD880E|nr:hypothetical protein [Streptomyces sp. CC77]OII65733.1 hypothetical protein BJP39_09090 [Streptomyces sp. CC77]